MIAAATSCGLPNHECRVRLPIGQVGDARRRIAAQSMSTERKTGTSRRGKVSLAPRDRRRRNERPVLSIAKKAKPSQAASRVLGAQGFYAVYAILKHEACRALS